MQKEGIIVFKYSSARIPEEFLNVVRERGYNVMGVAIARDGELITHKCELPPKQAMDTFQENVNDENALIFFGKFAEEHVEDDLQPFEIIEDGICAFLEGDLRGYSQPNSKHSDQFFAYWEYLRPKISGIFEMNGKDVEKTMSALKSNPLFRKDFEGMFSNMDVKEGLLVLFGSNGAVAEFGPAVSNADLGYSWGTVSRDIGYSEQTGEYPEKAPDKSNPFAALESKTKKSAEGGPINSAQGAAPAQTASPAPNTTKVGDTTIIRDTKPSTDSAIPTNVAGTEMKAPPKEIRGSNKAVKTWYRRFYGQVPPNWKECPEVPVKIVKSFKDIPPAKTQEEPETPPQKDVAAHHIPVVKQAETPAKPAEEPAPQPEKATDAKTVSADIKLPPWEDTLKDDATSEELPLLTDAQKEKLETFIDKVRVDAEKLISQGLELKTLDQQSTMLVLPPDKIQAMENKFPTFVDLANLSGLEDTFALSFKALYELCSEHPKAAAILLMNIRSNYCGLLAERKKEEKQQKKIRLSL